MHTHAPHENLVLRPSRPSHAPATAAQTRIFPYGPPREIVPDVWQIEGSLALRGVPRNMTIHRTSGGRLVLYSVIAMHEDGMRALEALGEPAWMVIPHDRHQMDAPFYRERYPRIRVLAPEPAKTRSVRVDAGLHELAELGIRAYALPGASYHEAILELPTRRGVALCTCELLGNARGLHGVLGLAMRVLGPQGGEFGVSRAVRWREVTDRNAVHDWLRALADRQDVRAILMGHGKPITRGVREALLHAAEHA